MKKLLAVVLFVSILGVACIPAGCDVNAKQAEEQPERFHRMSLSQPGSATFVEVVKDTVTQRCYAFHFIYGGSAGGDAMIGEVPCS